jgi:hypothetical protein
MGVFQRFISQAIENSSTALGLDERLHDRVRPSALLTAHVVRAVAVRPRSQEILRAVRTPAHELFEQARLDELVEAPPIPAATAGRCRPTDRIGDAQQQVAVASPS